METKNKTWFASHSHTWIVIVAASILAILFINWLPENKVFPSILVGLVASHLLILIIATFTGWLLIPEKLLRKKKSQENKYDFGWSSRWVNGFGFASVIAALLAFYAFFALEGSIHLQLITFTILLLLSFNFFIGNIIAKSSKDEKNLVLPYVDLLKNEHNVVLDAGCGSGRTTVSLAKVSKDVNIVAFDRFDASYIEGGGQALLKHNVNLAGIASRVTIETGDITNTPFPDNHFDAAVSSYMFDHLGDDKLPALQEMWRILKPGGRFLLVIVVRGYASFGMANVLSLAIDTREDWKQLFRESGFYLIDEGNINLGAYFLIEKN